MKNYTLYLYYRTQICTLNKKINNIRSGYAQRSSISSRNFEFDHLVEDHVRAYRVDIYKIKKKMCQLR